MKKTLLPIVLALCLLIGCAVPISGSVPQGDVAQGKPKAASWAAAGENETVQLIDKAGSAPAFSPALSGSVRFEEDASNKASVDFPADGTEKNLSLHDGDLTWELSIPADALPTAQTITMTAMKNISSTLGGITGGIVLKPDGLNFSDPATLSVKGEGVEKSGLVFSGNGDGTKLELSVLDRTQDVLQMKLFHFSTAYASGSADTMKSLSKAAQDEQSAAEKAAGNLLKEPIDVPAPPAIELKCHHDTEAGDQGIIDKYIADFGNPEADVVLALISAGKNVELEGGDFDSSLALKVAGRLLKKADFLIKRYAGKDDTENMFIAVSAAAIYADKNYQMLSGDHASYFKALADWAQKIAGKYLKELTEQHEYKNIHPIQKLAYYVGLFGNDGGALLQKLSDALTFKVETTEKVDIGINASIMSLQVDGTATVRLLDAVKSGIAPADGTGTYKAFTIPDMDGITATLDNLGTSFPIKFGVEGFLPCKSDTFNIYVDCFGEESDSITFTDPETGSRTVSAPEVQGSSDKAFSDHKKNSGYKFTLDVRDGQQVAAENTFNPSYYGVKIEYTVKFTHMTQGAQ